MPTSPAVPLLDRRGELLLEVVVEQDAPTLNIRAICSLNVVGSGLFHCANCEYPNDLDVLGEIEEFNTGE